MTENRSDMEGKWVKVVVIVSLLLWKIGESLLLCRCCCDCCCGRSVNQWPDFVEGWLAGCGRRRRGDESVPERRGNEIIKNVKKMNILLNKCVE